MGSAQKSSDPFDFPAQIIPRGMVYQWCAKTVLGQLTDSYTTMWEGGWRPVPAHRHRDVFARRVDADGNVAYGGQVLMCRLSEISEEAHQLNDDAAYRNAGAAARLVKFDDITFRLSQREMGLAEDRDMSCRQFALQQMKRMADGLDLDVRIRGYRGSDSYDMPGMLVFTRERTPRHRWLLWLFNLISKEV